MFQIPVQNLDNIRKARKKVKGILVDIGLDSCQELLQAFKSFDPGEKYFYNTSWSDVSLWDSVTKRKLHLGQGDEKLEGAQKRTLCFLWAIEKVIELLLGNYPMHFPPVLHPFLAAEAVEKRGTCAVCDGKQKNVA